MGSTYSFTNQTKNSVNVKAIDGASPEYRSFNTMDDAGRIVIFKQLLALNGWAETDVILAKTNNANDGIVQCYQYTNGVLTAITE